MLKSLYINNLAVVQELSVQFDKGINIITGETGAGKSIIVNAVKLLIGERFQKEMIRTGEKRTVIEGEIVADNKNITIRRVINKNGHTKSYINDEPVTLQELKKRTELLVDLHGQHEHQRLLNPVYHLDYIDAYGNYQSDLEELQSVFRQMNKNKNELTNLKMHQDRLDEKRELYEYQLKEMELFPLKSDLDIKLSEEYERLTNIVNIKEILLKLSILLDHDSGNSVNSGLGDAKRSISLVKHLDNNLQEVNNRIENMQVDLNDLVNDVKSSLNEYHLDDELLQVVSGKMEHLEMLKRKYGGSIDKVILNMEKIEEELAQSNSSNKKINELNAKVVALTAKYFDLAHSISDKRKSTAEIFEKSVIHNLNYMDMKNIQIRIEFTDLDAEDITENGLDKCQFFISPNIGEELRPLHKIASGGELSRIMLSIKMTLQRKDLTDTLFFDEVDSGISGSTAGKIGDILENIGEHHQVICITHLPQIASCGKTHYKVSKFEEDHRTFCKIVKLNDSERRKEIAEIISRSGVTESGMRQADELLGNVYG